MLKHRYYSKTKKEKNKIQLQFALGAFCVVLFFFLISWLSGIYLLGFLIVPLVLSIIAPFFDTPSLLAQGKLKYYSLLFLSEKPKKGVVKVHGGTLFDYVFVLDKKTTGTQRINFIVQQYLQGLLNLIEENKKNNEETLIIRGTSYIINEKTARRIGFKVIKTDSIQKLILIFNYLNLTLSLSIAKGRLTFPKLKETKTFEASLNGLLNKEEYLKQLNEKLKSTIAKNVEAK